MSFVVTAIVGTAVVGGLVSANAAKKQAKSNKQGLESQAAVDAHNAETAEWQAKDAIYRGQVAQTQQRLKTAALKGSQTARFAARGVATDEGSPLNILMDTEFMGDVDARTIADNAEKEAWALREGAENYQANSNMLLDRANGINPSGVFNTSLLASAGNVASSWYALGRGGGSPIAYNSTGMTQANAGYLPW